MEIDEGTAKTGVVSILDAYNITLAIFNKIPFLSGKYARTLKKIPASRARFQSLLLI